MPKPSPLMARPTRNPLKLLATATANIARPYTIDAVKTKIFLRRVHEEQDEEPASRARDQECRDRVAGEKFDEKGATNRRDRQTHTQDAGHQTALRPRDLVGQYCYESGEQSVEKELRHAPSDEYDQDVGCQRHN